MPVRASTTSTATSASPSACARLELDRAREAVALLEVDAAGVDQQEAAPVPLRLDLLAVARHAGLLVHDRLARAAEAVDERRLADVRIADDGDLRQAHLRSRASSPIRSTTSSMERPVVSTSTESGRRLRAASARASGPARRAAPGRAARRPRPRPAPRPAGARAPRGPRSGRPSAPRPARRPCRCRAPRRPSRRSAGTRRCRSTSAARTAGFWAILEAASETSGVADQRGVVEVDLAPRRARSAAVAARVT